MSTGFGGSSKGRRQGFVAGVAGKVDPGDGLLTLPKFAGSMYDCSQVSDEEAVVANKHSLAVELIRSIALGKCAGIRECCIAFVEWYDSKTDDGG